MESVRIYFRDVNIEMQIVDPGKYYDQTRKFNTLYLVPNYQYRFLSRKVLNIKGFYFKSISNKAC